MPDSEPSRRQTDDGTSVARCVLLADRHHGLTEGVRSLLESLFEVVVMVADEPSLTETAVRLQPSLAVVELALTRGESLGWLSRLRARCSNLRVIVLSVHDERSVEEAALRAGADGYVVKRAIVSDLIPAVEAVLAGKRYPSRGGAPACESTS